VVAAEHPQTTLDGLSSQSKSEQYSSAISTAPSVQLHLSEAFNKARNTARRALELGSEIPC
jgi:hypothetical protein